MKRPLLKRGSKIDIDQTRNVSNSPGHKRIYTSESTFVDQDYDYDEEIGEEEEEETTTDKRKEAKLRSYFQSPKLKNDPTISRFPIFPIKNPDFDDSDEESKFPDLDTLNRSSIKLAIELSRFHNEYLKTFNSNKNSGNSDYEKKRELIVKNIRGELCGLTKATTPNVQRKIEEIILSYEFPSLEVMDEERGPDLVDTLGNAYEDKTSEVKAKTGFKSNWMFILPMKTLTSKDINAIGSAADEFNYRKQLMVESLEIKMKGDNGGVIFRAKYVGDTRNVTFLEPYYDKVLPHPPSNRELNRYFVPGWLMIEYFQHKPMIITKKGNVKPFNSKNFGSERCRTCFHYHKVRELRDRGVEGLHIISSDDLIYEQGKSQCEPTTTTTTTTTTSYLMNSLLDYTMEKTGELKNKYRDTSSSPSPSYSESYSSTERESKSESDSSSTETYTESHSTSTSDSNSEYSDSNQEDISD